MSEESGEGRHFYSRACPLQLEISSDGVCKIREYEKGIQFVNGQLK